MRPDNKLTWLIISVAPAGNTNVNPTSETSVSPEETKSGIATTLKS